jgi:hypothetical protein
MNNTTIKNESPVDAEEADAVTISNNINKGQQNKGALRVRLFHIDVDTGVKQYSDVTFDVALGEEKRINLQGGNNGFEIRPFVESSAYAQHGDVEIDPYGVSDAMAKLKAAVSAVPAIRADMSLSETERDTKAAAAWAEAVRLAKS